MSTDNQIKPLTHDLDSLNPIDDVIEGYIDKYADGSCRVEVSTQNTSFDGFAESIDHASSYVRTVYPQIDFKVNQI